MPGKVVVPVEYIAPEPMDRPMTLILCTDLLVLVQPRGDGWDGQVDLFNVLRMATLRDPASIVHDNVLRIVDNKASGSPWRFYWKSNVLLVHLLFQQCISNFLHRLVSRHQLGTSKMNR